MNIDPIYSGLDEEQRSAVSAMDRSDRLIELASLRNRPTRELMAELAGLASIPVVQYIELT